MLFTIRLEEHSTYLTVCLCYGKTLDPLLGVGAVFGLEHEGPVVSEDLKGLGDVPPAFLGHLDRADRPHVQGLSHASLVVLNKIIVKKLNGGKIQNRFLGAKKHVMAVLTVSLYMSFAPERVKYRLFHFLNIFHFPPFFSFSCPSITGSLSCKKGKKKLEKCGALSICCMYVMCGRV